MREFKAVGKKEERGTPSLSDNSLIERVAAVAEDLISHLTLESASVHITLYECQKPLLWPQTSG